MYGIVDEVSVDTLNDAGKKVQKQIPEVFSVKSDLETFTKFTEKHLCRSLFHCLKSVRIRGYSGLKSALPKKCPYSGLFGVIQNNSENRHFSRSVKFLIKLQPLSERLFEDRRKQNLRIKENK